MKPDTLSIFELFERERRYVVPLFQRPYVWTKEGQWEPLWEDIITKANELLDQSDTAQRRLRNHFLGAVVLDPLKAYGRKIAESQIIDGQQRLTTLQILLFALRDVATAAKQAHIVERLKKIINHDPAEGDEKYKVWPTNFDRKFYEDVFAAGSPEALSAIYPLQRRKFSRYYLHRPRLVEAYLYFYGAIIAYVSPGSDSSNQQTSLTLDLAAEQRLDAFHSALTRHLQLVTIGLEDDDDAQVIFETLNARGVPLLPSDLIRNFVFLEAGRQGENQTHLYETYWREFDAADGQSSGFWKEEERQGRLTRPRLDLYIFNYLTFRTEQDILITHLFQEFRGWWASSSRSVEDELKQLKEYAHVFKALLRPTVDSRLRLFARRLQILDTSTLYPLLLFLLGEKKADLSITERDAILTDLESYLVRRMVCGLSTKNYNRFFLALLKTLRQTGQVSRDSVRSYLLASGADTSRWPSDKEFRDKWMSDPVYLTLKSSRVAMILEAIDLQLETSRQENVHIIGALSVEHIMPQHRSESEWPFPTSVQTGGASRSEAETRREALIHSFGNLTLLTQPLNSAISNGPFSKKRPEIAKQSKLRLNTYFQTLTDSDQWNEENIEARSASLFDIALQVWPRPNKAT